MADASGNETWPNAAGLIECGIVFQDPTCEQQLLAPDALNPDGTQPSGGVDVATGVAGESPLIGQLGGAVTSQTESWFSLPETQNYYDVTAENAEKSGYVVVQADDAAGLSVCAGIAWCFVPVGIDWRRSSEFNEQRVMSIIDDVLAVTGSDQVDIMAHSQGGLVANALVHDPASVGKIYRIVTLGTPYLGAPKLLDELLYAYPCQFPYSPPILGTQCLIDPTIVQSLIENYPGAAELVPSQGYFDANIYCPIFSGSECMTYAQSQAYIAAELAAPPLSRDDSLVSAAEAWHNADDPWAALDPQVGLLRMIGYDDDGGGPSCAPASYPCVDQENPTNPSGSTLSYINTAAPETLYNATGDGTVPLYSASLYNPATGFDDRGLGHDMYWCGYSHVGLAQSTDVWLDSLVYLEGDWTPTVDQGVACADGTEGSIAGLGLIGASSNSTVTVSSSISASSFGQPVTFTATVTPPTATGTVSFFDFAQQMGTGSITNGVASFETSTLALGTQNISATYSGDSSDIGSSTLTHIIVQVSPDSSATYLSSSVNPAVPGEPVLLKSTVLPSSATGSVSFFNGTTYLGAAALRDGSASLNIAFLSPGSYSISADYGGDTDDLGSSSAALIEQIVSSSSIAVTTPTNGANWARGKSHSVTWSSTGSVGAHVKIELLNGGKVLETISASVKTVADVYVWRIPAKVAVGSTYQIKIVSTTNSSVFGVSGDFSIT